MKKLPVNFTDEEHAAWVRYSNKKERRSERIGKFIGFIIVGAFMLWAYSNAEPHNKDNLVWIFVAGVIAYSFEQRLNTIVEKLENIERRLDIY
jgi:uncharacterized membrane protein